MQPSTKILLNHLYLPIFGPALALAVLVNDHDNNDPELDLANSPQEYFAYLATQVEDTKQSNVAYQSALYAMGYEDDLGECKIDSFLGEDTVSAIRKFQNDHDLEQTGQLDQNTREAVLEEVESSTTVQATLDNLIFQPFRTPTSENFIENINWQLSDLNRNSAALFRPDAIITIYAAIFSGTGLSQELIDAFSGPCSNYSKMDALRHSEAAVEIASYTLIPSFSAHAAVNLREYITSNETPVRLTDLLNHTIAIERFREIEGYDTQDIISDIDNGKYALQPLPVIEASFEYP